MVWVVSLFVSIVLFSCSPVEVPQLEDQDNLNGESSSESGSDVDPQENSYSSPPEGQDDGFSVQRRITRGKLIEPITSDDPNKIFKIKKLPYWKPKYSNFEDLKNFITGK